MSRELQRYSINNQMAAIAAYAEANALTIVRTYRDEGRSSLRIKGRPGLIELIEDVQSGQADFDHILVYHVSRWGRFQDVHAGHCRVASLGYRVGAPVGYGLRRLMVDESEHPKGFLEKAQFKALQLDRVNCSPAPPRRQP
jgi:hypothetical protein